MTSDLAEQLKSEGWTRATSGDASSPKETRNAVGVSFAFMRATPFCHLLIRQTGIRARSECLARGSSSWLMNAGIAILQCDAF